MKSKNVYRPFYWRCSSILMMLLAGLFVSCDSDKVTEKSLYTFVGETVYSYCRDRDEFSTFAKLMEDTKVDKLLSAYGHYTCFLPSDTAFATYFKENQTVYDSLTTQEKKELLFNHLITNEMSEYGSSDFEIGELPFYDMNNHSMTLSVCEGDTVYYINDCPILSTDNEVHNGVIHAIGRVIVESKIFLLDVLKQDSAFSLFSEAFEATHLDDSTHLIKDNNYTYRESGIWAPNPRFRKYGYTVFAETDDVFKKAGIDNLSDLVTYAEQYYGTKDRGNYSSRENALNKFISYHLLNYSLSTNSMVYNGPCTIEDFKDRQYGYYETFLKYRLMEIKYGNKINVQKDDSYVAIHESKYNLGAVNGYAHGLKNILVYDEDVMQNDVLNKRIRFDVLSLAPELTNNNIRWNGPADVNIPQNYCSNRIKMKTGQCVLCTHDSWSVAEGDEIWFMGAYDASIRLLPVPPGTYEVRLGYTTWSNRGIVQLFFDNQIVRIPIDMSKIGGEEIGWVLDSETEDGGTAADKAMRNQGYMKCPNCWTNPNYPGSNLRDGQGNLRYILGTYVFQDYSDHVFRVKNVENPELVFVGDYFEYVPKSYLLKEGKD